VALTCGIDHWNEVMLLITDFLPKQQPKFDQLRLHISIKSKRQTLRNGFALIEKRYRTNFMDMICTFLLQNSQVQNIEKGRAN